MDLQARILLLQRRQGVIGLHRLAERIRGLAKFIVERGHAVEGNLDAEQFQARLLKHAANHADRLVREPSIRRNVDLLHPVLLDELTADCVELLAQEGLAA